MAETCKRCGAKKGIVGFFTADMNSDTYTCQKCEEEIRREDIVKADRIKQAARKVIVTTTPKVDGYQVVAYLGIESVEFVIGTAIFSEVSSSIADFFGARSSAFERKLQAAKAHAMSALKYLAAEKGANAVIGVDLDYTEFSGNRVALIINGTLVKLAPVPGRSSGLSKTAIPEV